MSGHELSRRIVMTARWNLRFGFTALPVSLLPFTLACGAWNGGEHGETSDDYLGGGGALTTVVDYDDFSDGAGYASRWFDVGSLLSIGDPGVSQSKSFTGGQFGLGTPAYTQTYDYAYDHLKYFATSTQAFDIPVI